MPARIVPLRFVLALALALGVGACAPDQPLAPEAATELALSRHDAGPSDRACWGQASQVFARMGVMGEHSSQQDTPRVGLRNLARALYQAGILPEDTMQALGAFVAAELGLSIDACM